MARKNDQDLKTTKDLQHGPQDDEQFPFPPVCSPLFPVHTHTHTRFLPSFSLFACFFFHSYFLEIPTSSMPPPLSSDNLHLDAQRRGGTGPAQHADVAQTIFTFHLFWFALVKLFKTPGCVYICSYTQTQPQTETETETQTHTASSLHLQSPPRLLDSLGLWYTNKITRISAELELIEELQN